jgi:hypothetical protein
MLNCAAAAMYVPFGFAAAVQRTGFWILSSGEEHFCHSEIIGNRVSSSSHLVV